MSELNYKRTNVYKQADEAELKAITDYSEGYKKFLDASKTERETVSTTVKLAEAQGYKPYELGQKVKAGDKLYYNNRGKSLFLIRVGSENIEKAGIRILVAHVDSPRVYKSQQRFRQILVKSSNLPNI